MTRVWRGMEEVVVLEGGALMVVMMGDGWWMEYPKRPSLAPVAGNALNGMAKAEWDAVDALRECVCERIYCAEEGSWYRSVSPEPPVEKNLFRERPPSSPPSPSQPQPPPLPDQAQGHVQAEAHYLIPYWYCP